MQRQGPPLELLTRRLAECPPEFLMEPVIGASGRINTAAVVSDLLERAGARPLSAAEAAEFQSADAAQKNRLQIVLVGAWLLDEKSLKQAGVDREAALRFLTEEAAELAGTVKAPTLVPDPDRREELARLGLKALGLRPAGETVEQAQDRLQTMSSVERQRVIRASRTAEERMRQIREAMRQKAAEEAALRYGRE